MKLHIPGRLLFVRKLRDRGLEVDTVENDWNEARMQGWN